eukprot:m.488243 g.488243  ORF g.488243 m.488243 type:complete len:51 (-) comp25667_c0_seq1:243-395(-)
MTKDPETNHPQAALTVETSGEQAVPEEQTSLLCDVAVPVECRFAVALWAK